MTPYNPSRNADAKIKEPIYKVEIWTPEFLHVKDLILGTDDLNAVWEAFRAVVKRRPGGHYTLRQGAYLMGQHVPRVKQ